MTALIFLENQPRESLVPSEAGKRRAMPFRWGIIGKVQIGLEVPRGISQSGRLANIAGQDVQERLNNTTLRLCKPCMLVGCIATQK